MAADLERAVNAPGDELAPAALAIARIEYPSLDSAGYLDALERMGDEAAGRVARAVSKGMATYRKRSDKSSLKKRDGSLRDLGVNLAAGFSRTVRELSGVPYDLAKGFSTKRSRKRVRRQVRAASRLLRPLA